ncbi:MAG: methylated-DNA--[protein]-cysteine S-methyltransferase [Defluviitaleaceae bacterium]|nr:methylated-DNA--[protein]-cysteine S-methyltransferase [Defluviitaleaceae bacterium]
MKAIYESKLGLMTMETGTCADGSEALVYLDFADDAASVQGLPYAKNVKNSPVIAQCARELDEYFSGIRKTFDVPLMPTGTPFREKVWEQLELIPFGETISYLELANRVGNPKASRAVGSANGKNPIWLIIPCHRVITSDGSLGGYAGGLWRKEWLLEHEGVKLRNK